MNPTGLEPIKPDRRDYSVVHTFGATVDPKGLPDSFSIYDGREVPNQNREDTRFTPAVRPLPMGCTGESQTFLAGIADGALYRPDDLYDHTPPGIDGQGRGMRESLKATKERGFVTQPDSEPVEKRKGYFNCYGAGKIDDFDATRIALWLNQGEKRGVTVGTYWYTEFNNPKPDHTLRVPSFNTNLGSLHNWVATGWKRIKDVDHLEVIPWMGSGYGNNGRAYMSRAIYNALMAQPYTGAFTFTKYQGNDPIPVGIRAIIDNFVYWFNNLIGNKPAVAEPKEQDTAPQKPLEPLPESNREKLHEMALLYLDQDASPSDIADDEVGCAESVSTILHEVYPDFPVKVSTIRLNEFLKADKRFKATLEAKPGNIIISPTVGKTIGHCGIFTEGQRILNNNSKNGLWQNTYSLDSWVKYFRYQKGLHLYFYEPL